MNATKSQLRILDLVVWVARIQRTNIMGEESIFTMLLSTMGRISDAEGYNHNRSTYRGDLHCSFHAEMDAVSKLMSKVRLVGEENLPIMRFKGKLKS